MELVDVVVPVLVEELDFVVTDDALNVFVARDETDVRGLEDDVLLAKDVNEGIFVAIIVLVA